MAALARVPIKVAAPSPPDNTGAALAVGAVGLAIGAAVAGPPGAIFGGLIGSLIGLVRK